MSYPAVKTCAGCMKAIEERYLLKAVDKFWHTTCLKCCECGVVLEQIGKSCFVKGTAILCRYDYMRYMIAIFLFIDYCYLPKEQIVQPESTLAVRP